MTPDTMLVTAGLLGTMVVAAGAYALLYCAGKLRESRSVMAAASFAYALLVGVCAALVLITTLAAPWKVLILVSAVVYFLIPRVTWRYLVRTHTAHGGDR